MASEQSLPSSRKATSAVAGATASSSSGGQQLQSLQGPTEDANQMALDSESSLQQQRRHAPRAGEEVESKVTLMPPSTKNGDSSATTAEAAAVSSKERSSNSNNNQNRSNRSQQHEEEVAGELAKFARENKISLSEMLQGAKISESLKRYGSDPSHFARFVESVYTRASEKGHTPTEILAQCERINALEQKYGASFDNLKIRFERVGKEVIAKSKEAKSLAQEVSAIQTKRAKMLEQFSMDEKSLREYSEIKEQLSSINFDLKTLSAFKNCLLALRAERFDTKEVLEKLQVIGLLEPRKRALQAEITKQKEEVEKNKALLAQLKRAQETGLTLDQMDGIRRVVAQISAARGVPTEQAFNLFEQDVLKNYDASLGLIPEIARLNEEKHRVLSEIEARKSDINASERAHLEKIEKLEKIFASRAAEIQAFNKLREMGIEGAQILKFEKLLGEAALDFPVIASQLAKYKNLKELEEREEKKLVELRSQQASIAKSIEALTSDKKSLEDSVRLLKESAVAEVESAKAGMLATLSELNEKALSSLERGATQIVNSSERAMQDAARSSQQGISAALEEGRAGITRAVSEVSRTASAFSSELKETLSEAEAEIKVVSQALEAGEKIGKYEAILPLLEIMSGENDKVHDAEALIAMWNVSSRFNMWMSARYGDQKKREITEPLSSLVKAMNDEIQRVDG